MKLSKLFRTTVLLATTLIVSSMPAVSNESQASEEIPLMQFAWPATGKASVVESTLKKGKRTKTAYDLNITTSKDKNLTIDYQNFKFLALEGYNLNDPKTIEQLKPTLAMASAIPGFKINSKGHLVSVNGLETMLEKVKSNITFNTKEEAAKMEKVWAMFKSPVMKQTMEAKIASIWNAWVGTIVGLPNDQEIGALYAIKTEAATFGSVIPFDLTYERLAVTNPAHKGLTKWQITSAAESDALNSALVKFFNNISVKAGKPAEFDIEKIKMADQRTIITIITDPQTLKPTWVKTESKVNIHINGEKPRSQIEEHVYEFTWQ